MSIYSDRKCFFPFPKAFNCLDLCHRVCPIDLLEGRLYYEAAVLLPHKADHSYTHMTITVMVVICMSVVSKELGAKYYNMGNCSRAPGSFGAVDMNITLMIFK